MREPRRNNMSGNLLIQALRRISPELKLIAMTGADHQRNDTACHEMGADAFVKKPFGSEKILSVVRDLISFRKSPSH